MYVCFQGKTRVQKTLSYCGALIWNYILDDVDSNCAIGSYKKRIQRLFLFSNDDLITWFNNTWCLEASMVIICLFVCFITKSFLTYSFFLPTPTLSTICRPLSSYTCSITPETVNVGSSYSHLWGPGVGCWLSDRSNCSHWSFEAVVLPINPNIYTDQWEPIVI